MEWSSWMREVTYKHRLIFKVNQLSPWQWRAGGQNHTVRCLSTAWCQGWTLIINKQTRIFWWKLTSCPTRTGCAEVIKANICHLIKGYDLLTLELLLVTSKAELLTAVVTSRQPNCSSFLCNLWQFYFYVLQRAVPWWWLGTTDHLAGSTHQLQLQTSPKWVPGMDAGKGKPWSLPIFFTGQEEKESKRSEVSASRQPGKQS